jgi:hypothetical protein
MQDVVARDKLAAAPEDIEAATL